MHSASKSLRPFLKQEYFCRSLSENTLFLLGIIPYLYLALFTLYTLSLGYVKNLNGKKEIEQYKK